MWQNKLLSYFNLPRSAQSAPVFYKTMAKTLYGKSKGKGKGKENLSKIWERSELKHRSGKMERYSGRCQTVTQRHRGQIYILQNHPQVLLYTS